MNEEQVLNLILRIRRNELTAVENYYNALAAELQEIKESKSVVTNPNTQTEWGIGSDFAKFPKTNETLEEYLKRQRIKPLDIAGFQAPPVEKEIPYTLDGTSHAILKCGWCGGNRRAGHPCIGCIEKTTPRKEPNNPLPKLVCIQCGGEHFSGTCAELNGETSTCKDDCGRKAATEKEVETCTVHDTKYYKGKHCFVCRSTGLSAAPVTEHKKPE